MRCQGELKSKSIGPHIENYKELVEKMRKYADKFAQGAKVLEKYTVLQKAKAKSCVPILTKATSVSPINPSSETDSNKRHSEEAGGTAEQRAVIDSLRTLVAERRANISQKIDEAPVERDKEEGDPLDFNDDEDVMVRPFSKYEFEDDEGALRCKKAAV